MNVINYLAIHKSSVVIYMYMFVVNQIRTVFFGHSIVVEHLGV